MLRKLKDLEGYSLEATDGEIGKVVDFFFDDDKWVIRYLVAKTGGWLSGEKVLIGSVALEPPRWDKETFPVDLTKERIENAPDVDVDKPISRQREIELHDYYDWPAYWPPMIYYGYENFPPFTPPKTAEEKVSEDLDKIEEKERKKYDPHLRSTNEVTGYKIHALNGDIGHVEDLVMDDEVLSIRYMVVDTKNLLPGKKVLVSPLWIERIVWEDRHVTVNLQKETIKEAPEYDPDTVITPEYEEMLFEFYGRSYGSETELR